MKKINKNWVCIACLTILPFICCMAMCICEGVRFSQIYLPASQWNDEVVYYKWVEGVVEYGVPQGYFGYNENHANYLNFATWSPVLNIFWVIFGKVFGWSFISPIFCNILLISLAMFLFSLWVKPDVHQTIALVLLFTTHATITRFMLSGLAEIPCYFLLILFAGLMLKKEKKKWTIIILFLLVYCITLMRPYYILLCFVPAYYWFTTEKKKAVISVSAVFFFITICSYIWLNKNLCAPYFVDLFHTEWIKVLFTDFSNGMFNALHIMLNSGKKYLQYIGNGLTGSSVEYGFISQGGWCVAYFFIFVWLIYKFYHAYKNNDKNVVLYAYGVLSFVLMLFAVFYLFDVFNGSKHLMGFTVFGIFVMAVAESLNKKTAMLGILFIYLFTMKATSEYEWALPIATQELEQEIISGENQLASALQIDTQADRWDNTVIWLLSDISSVKWQNLYAFPAGMGINLCQKDYILNNFENIKSKYLMTSIGEEVDHACEEKNKKLIAEYGQVHVWKLH